MNPKSGPCFVSMVLAVTKAPTPWRFWTKPSSARSESARRTVIREIENWRQSASWVGSASPGR